MIKLVYVGGPYRADTEAQVDTNIAKAREMGKRVARMGAYPVTPHSNTAHFDGTAPDAFWLPATLELARRCDAMVVCDGWETSKGTRGEIDLMHKLARPVFFETQSDPVRLIGGDMHDLENWIAFETAKEWIGSDPVAVDDAIETLHTIHRMVCDRAAIAVLGILAFARVSKICEDYFERAKTFGSFRALEGGKVES